MSSGKLTHYMELSPSWEANTSWATQEIPCILWNLKAHYRIHNSPPPVPTSARPIQSMHHPSKLLKIHFNIILPSTPGSFKWFLPSDFPTKTLYAPLLSPFRAHLSIVDWIARMISGEEYIA